MKPRAIIWTDQTGPYGVGRFVAMLTDGLNRKGWAASVAMGVDAFGEAPMRAFSDIATPSSLLDEGKPDVVVFVNASPLSNVAAQKAARQRGLARAVVVQGGAMPPIGAGAVQVLSGVAASELRMADVVVAPSHALLTELRSELIGPTSGSMIANGAPDAFFTVTSPDERRQARAELGLPNDAIVCLSAARMEHAKGWDLLLDAAIAARARGVDALHFVWAGDGTKRKRLAALVRMHGLDDRVRLLGLVQDVAPLVRVSDVFVLPTRDDVAPFAIAEAMAGGLPIIATDVGEIRMMVGGAGIVLADPSAMTRAEAVAALADALAALAASTATREAFGAEARARADREHRASTMVSRYDELLRSLL